MSNEDLAVKNAEAFVKSINTVTEATRVFCVACIKAADVLSKTYENLPKAFDQSVIGAATVLKEYCRAHEDCAGCIFQDDIYNCELKKGFPEAWSLPDTEEVAKDDK